MAGGTLVAGDRGAGDVFAARGFGRCDCGHLFALAIEGGKIDDRFC